MPAVPDISITAHLLSDQEQKAVKTSCQKLWSDRPKWKLFWPAWTTLAEGQQTGLQPQLHLLPLERLNAIQGFSGSRVVIGYFDAMRPKSARTHAKSDNVYPSKPMVIKLSAGKTKRNELKKENKFGRAIGQAPAEQCHGRFAAPLHYDDLEEDNLGVLWSPYFSDQYTKKVGRPQREPLELFPIDDLSKRLREPRGAQDILKNRIVEGVYDDLLEKLHDMGGGPSIIRNSIVKEYTRHDTDYLRDARGKWFGYWKELWGPPKIKKIQVRGKSWVNPLWVLEKLEALRPVSLVCGPVHGDLHPRNIVLDRNTPGIIDFGWARPRAHIVKDFVLLECNLRFMLLHPHAPTEDILKLVHWVGINARYPDMNNEECNAVAKLIRQVRERAVKRLETSSDKDFEYVVPLFLVSLGLLKHLRDADNQESAQLTVLEAASYVSKKFLPR